mmetsp:Transcript_19689/g.56461  ORF Transcript_19689/g.56461 Transcript_19689/m.56461 type:complete len:265 (-) Transcript_19689:281-1075(-)
MGEEEASRTAAGRVVHLQQLHGVRHAVLEHRAGSHAHFAPSIRLTGCRLGVAGHGRWTRPCLRGPLTRGGVGQQGTVSQGNQMQHGGDWGGGGRCLRGRDVVGGRDEPTRLDGLSVVEPQADKSIFFVVALSCDNVRGSAPEHVETSVEGADPREGLRELRRAVHRVQKRTARGVYAQGPDDPLHTIHTLSCGPLWVSLLPHADAVRHQGLQPVCQLMRPHVLEPRPVQHTRLIATISTILSLVVGVAGSSGGSGGSRGQVSAL